MDGFNTPPFIEPGLTDEDLYAQMMGGGSGQSAPPASQGSLADEWKAPVSTVMPETEKLRKLLSKRQEEVGKPVPAWRQAFGAVAGPNFGRLITDPGGRQFNRQLPVYQEQSKLEQDELTKQATIAQKNAADYSRYSAQKTAAQNEQDRRMKDTELEPLMSPEQPQLPWMVGPDIAAQRNSPIPDLSPLGDDALYGNGGNLPGPVDPRLKPLTIQDKPPDLQSSPALSAPSPIPPPVASANPLRPGTVDVTGQPGMSKPPKGMRQVYVTPGAKKAEERAALTADAPKVTAENQAYFGMPVGTPIAPELFNKYQELQSGKEKFGPTPQFIKDVWPNAPSEMPISGVASLYSAINKKPPAAQRITNEYEGLVQQHTDPTGAVDWKAVNDENDKRQIDRTVAGKAPVPHAPVDPNLVSYWGKEVMKDAANWQLISGNKTLAPAVQQFIAASGGDITRIDAATRSTETQGNVIQAAGRDLIAAIDQNKGKLGNIGAYWSQAINGTPIADPDISGLMTQIGSFAALQPKLHGFRGQQALAEFNKLIGGPPKNPEAMKASIRKIMQTAGVVSSGGRGGAQQPQDSGIPRISNEDEYNKLPAGPYIDPNGVQRMKK